jgi:hypothetical protein
MTKHFNTINRKKYEALSKSTIQLARKIIGNYSLPPRELLVKASVVAKKKVAAMTIQRAFRKTRKVTDETFLKMLNRYDPKNFGKMLNFGDREYGTENFNMIRNMIYEKRHHPGVEPSVTKIQAAYRGYESRRTTPVKAFVTDLYKDGRFEYYAELLNKLYVSIPHTIGLIKVFSTSEARKIINK